MSDVVWESCIYKGCGYSPFPMEANYHKRVKDTGEGFQCPSGHRMVYNGGLSRDQKRIKEMSASNRDERDAARLTCQWIQCGFRAKDLSGLYTHMRARHGMPTLAEVAEAS